MLILNAIAFNGIMIILSKIIILYAYNVITAAKIVLLQGYQLAPCVTILLKTKGLLFNQEANVLAIQDRMKQVLAYFDHHMLNPV